MPNGESVKTRGALAVAPFILGKDSNLDVSGLLKEKRGLLVVNVPLLGTSTTLADGPGFKPANPDKVMVDFLIWNGPDSGLGGTNWTHIHSAAAWRRVPTSRSGLVRSTCAT